MKKVLMFIVIAIVCCLLGFFVGSNMNGGNGFGKAEKELVGTYKTSTWNGKDGVLVLKEDGTCIHPSGNSGTWSVEGEDVIIEFESSYTYFDGVTGKDNTNTSTTTHKATIVDKGLMMGTHFFEKL